MAHTSPTACSTRAAAQEAGYRDSLGALSEVKLVRNVLVQTDPDLPAEVKGQLDGCTGA